jgi:alkylation response protein AidB-like acyl-CoA dehydrogenase
MEFAFSEEQDLLAATVSALADDLLGPATARAAMDGDRKLADVAWDAVVDAGWTGLLVPASEGGVGATLVDACIVAEGLASALGPVPFAGSAIVAAAGLALLGGDSDDLAAVASGVPHAVAVGMDLDWPPAPGPSLLWDWVPGAVAVVPGREGLVATRRVRAERATAVDLLRPLAHVESSERAVVDPDAARRFRATAQVAAAAVATGAAAAAMTAAVEHARTRHQFGTAIGTFQAVQHLCADMLVDVESARSVLYGAAWSVESLEPGRAAWAAAVAKAWCGRAAVRVCENAVQVFGGMGITWECDVHLHLRAAHQAAASFGSDHAVIEDVGAGVLAAARASMAGAS